MFVRNEQTSLGDTPLVAVEADLPDEMDAAVSVNEVMLASRLALCMEQKKMFLDPTLAMRDVALAIGTNMTYLSLYLNRNQGVTFYDYVNRFRVEEACRIIESMSETGRINMTQVARQSGFNSVSSFNRYFKKVKGNTPKAYYHQYATKSSIYLGTLGRPLPADCLQ